MHIRGNGLPTQEIELCLKPVDTHYVLNMRPLEFPKVNPNESIRFGDRWENCAVIHFEDTHELQTLIDMLVKFRDDNFGYLGEWRKAP